MNKLFFFILLIPTFLSCLKENKIVLKQNFEKPQDGWNNENVITGDARSGIHFTRTDSLHKISAEFSKKLSDIANHKIKRIDIVTWIKESTQSAQGSFIMSLDNNGQQVLLMPMSVGSVIPAINEWTRMYASYDLPDSVGINENLKVYLLNEGKFTIDADDFEIRLYY